ncbi:M23 family metallopeptidase [Nocardia shimofusensis]|uniref:M23 family metallopeptidase n=1 Tax=Nocardia shimofusensis TaxID=228596 RepID=UPI00082A28D5
MSNRSTLTELAAGAFSSGPRSRSGHRYRDDDQPFMPAAAPLPPSTNHHAAPAAAGFGAHAAGNAAWDETAAWSQAGGAWNEGSAWNESAQDHVSAAPDASAWNQDSGTAWNNDAAWNDGSAWNQDEDPAWHQQGSWNDGGAWGATEAAEPEGAPGWNQDDPSQWQGTCDSDAWARQSQYAPEAENGWHDDESDDDRSDASLVGTPVAPTFIPGRGAARRGGAHRVPAPPGSLKGRAAVVAVAAGAVVAAGQAAMASPGQPSQTIDYEAAGQIHEIAAQSVSLEDPTTSSAAPQVLNVSAPSNLGQFDEILEKGRKYAEDLAAAEAAKLRPLFAQFTYGNFTSGYGARWGVQHLGVDIAAPIGTPIYAVADGTVLEAGPASGFGMWVRVLHDDGTVTVYGHVDTALVSAGQYVMAGDQIATVGNRGFSTGPHVHFEVWLNGTDKVDPLPWLASRGIALGQIRS